MLTLRTRDHADIVDAQVAFHLNAGVDFVLANDHRSQDGTREILDEYVRAGVLDLVRRDEEGYTPGEWVNELARRACLEHGADWVVHTDADEFWWPHGGNLKDVLGAIPERFGALLCPWRHFAPLPDDDRHFAERMIVRRGSHAPDTGPGDPFHAHVNVAHRGHPAVRVSPGNHDLDAPFPVLRGWFPIEVLHFPLRSRAQAEAKFVAWSSLRAGIAPHVDAAGAALREGGFEEYGAGTSSTTRRAPRASLPARSRSTRGCAMRSACSPGTMTVPLPERPELRLGAPLEFPELDVPSKATLADDTAVLHNPDAAAERRIDRFEARLSAFEQRAPARLARRARRVLRGTA